MPAQLDIHNNILKSANPWVACDSFDMFLLFGGYQQAAQWSGGTADLPTERLAKPPADYTDAR